MARIYVWPREQWWRCTLRADGRRGWCKRQRIGAQWVYTYWDGLQTERRFVGTDAAAEALESERASGALVYADEQQAESLTRSQAYFHRD